MQNENKGLSSSLAQQDRSFMICHQKSGTSSLMTKGFPPVAEIPVVKVHLKLGNNEVQTLQSKLLNGLLGSRMDQWLQSSQGIGELQELNLLEHQSMMNT